MKRDQYKPEYEREQQMLESIISFRDIYGYSPSYQQLADITGLSKARVAQIVNILEIKKLIAKDGNKARTIQVLCEKVS
jgi:SOS-response transcriptional repressor LexA